MSEKREIFGVGGFLFNPKTKKILLQKRDAHAPINPNKWAVFGGTPERGEKPLETFIREMREELGVMLDPQKVQPLQDFIDGKTEERRHSFFAFSELAREEMTLAEGEDFDWFSLDEALALDLTPNSIKDLSFFRINILAKMKKPAVHKPGSVWPLRAR